MLQAETGSKQNRLPHDAQAIAKSSQLNCKKFANSFISYYSSVFHVSGCKRYKLESHQVYELTKKSKKVHEVDSSVIDSIPLGGAYLKSAKKEKESICKKYERTYITFSFMDVYWVENCKKKRFPDWASYESHRGKLNKEISLHSLELDDFSQIAEIDPMPSVINEEFRETINSDQVDMIPVDEACKGIQNQFVTYLGQMFYIESIDKGDKGLACQKRQVDAEIFTRKKAGESFRLRELNSSQAISIPDGGPYVFSK